MNKNSLSLRARNVFAALQCMSRVRAQASREAQFCQVTGTRPQVGRRMLARVAELDQAALGLTLLLDEQEQELVYQAYIDEARR